MSNLEGKSGRCCPETPRALRIFFPGRLANNNCPLADMNIKKYYNNKESANHCTVLYIITEFQGLFCDDVFNFAVLLSVLWFIMSCLHLQYFSLSRKFTSYHRHNSVWWLHNAFWSHEAAAGKTGIPISFDDFILILHMTYLTATVTSVHFIDG